MLYVHSSHTASGDGDGAVGGCAQCGEAPGRREGTDHDEAHPGTQDDPRRAQGRSGRTPDCVAPSPPQGLAPSAPPTPSLVLQYPHHSPTQAAFRHLAQRASPERRCHVVHCPGIRVGRESEHGGGSATVGQAGSRRATSGPVHGVMLPYCAFRHDASKDRVGSRHGSAAGHEGSLPWSHARGHRCVRRPECTIGAWVAAPIAYLACLQ